MLVATHFTITSKRSSRKESRSVKENRTMAYRSHLLASGPGIHLDLALAHVEHALGPFSFDTLLGIVGCIFNLQRLAQTESQQDCRRQMRFHIVFDARVMRWRRKRDDT